MEEPLVYTVKGNVPAESLKLETHWTVNEHEIVCDVHYYLEGVLVRNDLYIKKLTGEQMESAPGSFT